MGLHQPQSSTSTIAHACWYGLGLLVIVHSLGASLLAGATFPAPEIEAGSLAAGLGILAGGVLILRSRRRSK
jgi:hypothetical protein